MQRVSRTRTALHCQPAHHLLLDAGYPMNPDVAEIILKAVESVLVLGSSLYGGVRIPGFGVSFINNHYFNVLQVIQIRGNMPKIMKSLKTLKEMVTSNARITFQELCDLLKLSIIKILEEYSSNLDFPTRIQGKSTSQFVLITLVTLKDGLKIQSYLEELLQSTENKKLKKIQILQISESDNGIEKRGDLVDLIQMKVNEFKLEQFFKQWLLDCDTSQEHACISFQNSGNGNTIKIKCDIIDNIINPFLLPFGHCYQVQTDYFKGSGMIKFPAKHIPVYDFQVLSRISGLGLCESLLFGSSQRLLPTKCWQIEGNELIHNQQYFYYICKQLLDNDEYLLVAISNYENNTNVTGHFILIPGKSSLLLRAVAPSELVLPYTSQSLEDTTLQENIKMNMDSAFSRLPVIEDVLPSRISSNLYNALKSNLTQKAEHEDQSPGKLVDHPALETPQSKLCHTKKRRLF